MSQEQGKKMQPVGKDAPELFRKMADFLGGSRNTSDQVRLILGGVNILVGVLRQIIGDDATKLFLNDILSDVKSGKKPAFAVEILTKH